MCQVKHAVLPVSSRTSNFEDVEIELQQLPFFVNKYGIASNPSWGPTWSNNEFGRRLTLRFFLFRSWLMLCAWTKRSHSWIWMDAKLVMMASRPGGDGTQGCEEHRWDRTQGVSFLDQCEGRLLTENLDSRLLVRYPSITSYFKFGIQICFSTYVECVLQKKQRFLICYESSTSHLLDTLLTSLPPLQN